MKDVFFKDHDTPHQSAVARPFHGPFHAYRVPLTLPKVRDIDILPGLLIEQNVRDSLKTYCFLHGLNFILKPSVAKLSLLLYLFCAFSARNFYRLAITVWVSLNNPLWSIRSFTSMTPLIPSITASPLKSRT